MNCIDYKLPIIIGGESYDQKLKVSYDQLLFKNKDDRYYQLSDNVSQFMMKYSQGRNLLIVLKDKKIWAQENSVIEKGIPFSPLLQKGYQDIQLGDISAYEDKFIIFCLGKLDVDRKLLYWEKNKNWLGPFELVTAEDIRLTNSSSQSDDNENVHLLYVLKNGRIEQLYHRLLNKNKWSSPILIASNHVDEVLTEPILVCSEQILEAFWIGKRGEHIKIYYSYTEWDPTSILKWRTPMTLTSLNAPSQNFYIAAGKNDNKSSDTWLIWKYAGEVDGLISNKLGEWEQMKTPETLYNARLESQDNLGWGQRIMIDDNQMIWLPSQHHSGDQTNTQTQTHTQAQTHKMKVSGNYSDDKNDAKDSQASANDNDWRGGPLPPSRKNMLKNSLKKKGRSKTYQTNIASSSKKENSDGSTSPPKEITEIKNELSRLKKQYSKLSNSKSELLKRIESLEHELQKITSKLSQLDNEQNLLDNNQNTEEKSLWQKLFK